MNTYTTHIELMGVWGERKVTLEYDYQPRERMTDTYPGCPESVEITDASFLSNGQPYNCFRIIPPEQMDSLRLEILEHEAGKRELAESRREAAREDYLDMRAEMRREERL
jgi:hypothetical protein